MDHGSFSDICQMKGLAMYIQYLNSIIIVFHYEMCSFSGHFSEISALFGSSGFPHI